MGPIFESMLGWYPEMDVSKQFLFFWKSQPDQSILMGFATKPDQKEFQVFRNADFWFLYWSPAKPKKDVKVFQKNGSKPPLLGSKIAFFGGGQPTNETFESPQMKKSKIINEKLEKLQMKKL